MKKLFQTKFSLAFTLACYAGAVLLFLAVHLVGFAANRMAYANGSLQTQNLPLSAFDFYGIEQRGENELFCFDGDPRLVLKDTSLRVDTVRFEAEYSLPPELLNVFWAPPGQDHSVRRMAYARGTARNTFWLAPTGGQSLRIDPGTVAGNVITVHDIVINEKRPFAGFFVPTAGEAALLLVLPGLCACAALVLRSAGWWPRRRQKAGDAHG